MKDYLFTTTVHGRGARVHVGYAGIADETVTIVDYPDGGQLRIYFKKGSGVGDFVRVEQYIGDIGEYLETLYDETVGAGGYPQNGRVFLTMEEYARLMHFVEFGGGDGLVMSLGGTV